MKYSDFIWLKLFFLLSWHTKFHLIFQCVITRRAMWYKSWWLIVTTCGTNRIKWRGDIMKVVRFRYSMPNVNVIKRIKYLSNFTISDMISYIGLGRSKLMSIVCRCNVIGIVSQFRWEWSLASAKADNWQTCCSWIPTWDLVILTTSKSRSYEREVSRYINMARISSSKWHHYDKDYPFIQSPVVASLSSFTQILFDGGSPDESYRCWFQIYTSMAFLHLRMSLARRERGFRVLDIKYRYPRVALPTDGKGKGISALFLPDFLPTFSWQLAVE